jgi:sodium-dependent dicarboxylate transporter 2/3/5
VNSISRASRYIPFILGPILFIVLQFSIPDDFISPTAGSVLALAAWMITWWVTEAVPIPVTSLLPLILLPLLGTTTIKEAAAPYAHPIIFLFMGGFMIALALEKHRLHERIALNLIRITGTSGNGIILGFMIATALLSMWISNTATAMMMLPIALSVVHLLNANKNLKPHELPRNERNFALGLLLMVGYAATLGGLATIIGTPPNVVFSGLLDEFYGIKLNFGQWMLMGVPVSAALLLSTYFIITSILFPNQLKSVEGAEELIARKLNELGAISTAEKRVMLVFSITSFLWIFQHPLNTYVLRSDLLSDTNIAMTGGLLMFIVPEDFRRLTFLLDWKDTINLQWGILILFGGGLSLAGGLENADVINTVGHWLARQGTFNIWLAGGLIITTVVLSEFLSNVALVQIFVPVIFGIADGLDINPIFMAMPITLSASIGFMFPIATPPNAIVFSSGYIRMKNMIRAGLLLDVASMIIILLAAISLVKWVYG